MFYVTLLQIFCLVVQTSKFHLRKMSKCISIHVGQAGVQVGNACWELYCLEHGIQPDGKPVSNRATMDFDDSANSFFEETSSGKFVPLSIFVDLEPTVIDKMRTGAHSRLFPTDQLFSFNEGGGKTFAGGFHSIGRRHIEVVVDKIRKLSESSEIKGFLVFHSLSGGTGSGFASLLLEKLRDNFKYHAIAELMVVPSTYFESEVFEPYNSVLGLHKTLEYSDSAYLFDNAALKDICRRSLHINMPTYRNVNECVAATVSCLTSSIRFSTPLRNQFFELQKALIPYPRMRFPLISYAPIIAQGNAPNEEMSPTQLLHACFEPNQKMLKCGEGKYIAGCVLYKGDIVVSDMNTAIRAIKKEKNNQFVDWSPRAFKINTNAQLVVPGGNLAEVQRAICMLSNTTAITEVWSRLGHKFDRLYKKQAFVHWYMKEGMMEEEFPIAREDLAELRKEYEDILKDSD